MVIYEGFTLLDLLVTDVPATGLSFNPPGIGLVLDVMISAINNISS